MADYSPKTAGKQRYEHGDTFPHASRLEAELHSNLMLVQLHSDRTCTPARRPGARVPAPSGSRRLAAPAEHPYRQLHDVPDQAAEQCSRPVCLEVDDCHPRWRRTRASSSGTRDGAVTSVRLEHINRLDGSFYHDAREVRNKNSKTFTTFFLSVDDAYLTSFKTGGRAPETGEAFPLPRSAVFAHRNKDRWRSFQSGGPETRHLQNRKCPPARDQGGLRARR
ncbi:MAG: hypothetical protein ACI9IV_001626, partial [Paracoccaceae bacterium]